MSDEKNEVGTMAQGWHIFSEDYLAEEVGSQQRRDMNLAFFEGGRTMFEMMLGTMHEAASAEDVEAAIERIGTELITVMRIRKLEELLHNGAVFIRI